MDKQCKFIQDFPKFTRSWIDTPKLLNLLLDSKIPLKRENHELGHFVIIPLYNFNAFSNKELEIFKAIIKNAQCSMYQSDSRELNKAFRVC